MNAFSDLLRKAAAELRAYAAANTEPLLENDWLEALARRMEAASNLPDGQALEDELDTLAYLIIDSLPLTPPVAPSFTQALDALQRRRKKRGGQA